MKIHYSAQDKIGFGIPVEIRAKSNFKTVVLLAVSIKRLWQKNIKKSYEF